MVKTLKNNENFQIRYPESAADEMKRAMEKCFIHLPACKKCGSHFWWSDIYSISIGKSLAKCGYCQVYEVIQKFIPAGET